ncbi:N-acetylmuramoyl-L-alanine amidase [Pallidibacillus thermolactis]|jgi:N-acetylmuramoyl-L-alanine amidase|uniref:N-acetylmuramoyl-L-alanine amidase n=1 Tax=Pallidibacillus thermolactis TaxID=251051 RepID=UPI002E1EBD5B|nr:N-acetylmuramoyl-L-alanine amidase [Pallidibacillus thermolactis]MED1672581.1 N-acetylmuramoyl-L-alanine amidase [Pallidibacillus thermolactis subsp. kokeshiiformis]
MKFKVITTFLLFMTFMLFSTPMDNTHAAGLSDVPSNYAVEIYYLHGQGVITGYPDGTFRPSQNVRRDEAAAMIGRALKLNGKQRETKFIDVPAANFASGYIQSAAEKKILEGYGNGYFKPEANMTRLEMAYMIAKAFGYTESTNVHYTDMPSNPAHVDVIKKVTNAGIVNGYVDGSFRPNQAITRGEFAIMVARALNADLKVGAQNNVQPIKQVVTADILNVRSGPSVSYQVVSKLSYFTEVNTYNQTGDWVFITFKGGKGYVHSKYLADPSAVHDNKQIIAVDAGHGGRDPGAIGNGLVEKEINLDVAKRLKADLEANGYQVVMTRSDDTYVELQKRVDIAKQKNADIFVSIHTNSFTSSSAKGSESYYYDDPNKANTKESKQLATFIQNRIVEALDTSDRGVKHQNLHVLRENSLPSVLVELAFITNEDDAAKLGSPTYREAAAHAIYLGIQDYFAWLKQ